LTVQSVNKTISWQWPL